MARKKHKSAGKKKLPMAIILPAAAPAMGTVGSFVAGDYKAGMNGLMYGYAGITADGKLDSGQIVRTYVPVAVGILVHKFAGRYVNRYLPKWVPIQI